MASATPAAVEELIVVIKPGGIAVYIHDDRLAGLMGAGDATIERASHVEPGEPTKGQNPLRWYADMAPVKGPVLSGEDGLGFPTRDAALRAEVLWLKTNYLSKPAQ